MLFHISIRIQVSIARTEKSADSKHDIVCKHDVVDYGV